MRLKVVVAVFCGLMLSAQGAGATPDKPLTEEDIRAFYKEMEQVQTKDAKRVVDFYTAHLHKDSVTRVSILKHSMGNELEPEFLTLNKVEILGRIEKAHTNSPPDEAVLEVIKIDIASDGLSAEVKENMYGRFTLKSKDGEVENSIPAEQSVLCEDELVLSPATGEIQIRESACEIKASIGKISGLAADKKEPVK
jgi:hypothetical protein